MGSSPRLTDTPKAPVEARESLERLLADPTIIRAPRIRIVLSYILDRWLAGEGDTITEETIGQAVFGKPEGYNRGDDNIVRVTVRHLRAKLEAYYAAAGCEESWILEIPKGSYAPVLRPRSPAPPTVEAPLVAAASISTVGSTARRPFARWMLSAMLLFGNFVFAFLWYRETHPNLALGAGLAQELLLRPGQRVSIIPADANLQLYRMMYNRTVLLSDYVIRGHIEPDSSALQSPLRGALSFIRSSADISLASSLVAQRLQRAGPQTQIRIRHPRELSVSDFQQDDVILLGGPWINPWGQLFEDRLNFRLNPPKEDASISQVENRKPENGEPAVFRNHQDGAFAVGYARIAMLPNLSDSCCVLLLGATDQGSIEAGGQYVVDPTAFRELLSRLHAASTQALPFFELVLEVRSVNNTPREVRILTSRIVAPARER